ncbi:Mbov_0401 family ICE element transposase-like protein [[Mycoplasma] gypis]|uniref:Transposase n=1 Tax=[Mycoplasma] gypis TaxID=92404 RepID=A0ABZ2RSC7_9BACT|nr:hypothetical protein [[Mycoplasma] gypis]MBN0919378.1 hypothetical protein [[Mycoplasma] gypis]
METNEIYSRKNQLFIEALNQKEEYFRIITRKSNPTFSHWKVEKTMKRNLILEDGVYQYNITMYYFLDKNGNKHRFIYYHDEYLKKLKRNKFSLEIMQIAKAQYLENSSKISLFSGYFPTIQNIKYHLKKEKLQEKLEEKNIKVLNNIIGKSYAKIDIMTDDCFVSYNRKSCNFNKQLMIRCITLICYSEDNKIDKITLLFTKKNNENIVLKSSKKLKEILKKIRYNQLHLYGDGAIWIKNLAKEIKANFHLDKFHLFHKFNDAFKRKNGGNLKVFNTFYCDEDGELWSSKIENMLKKGNEQEFKNTFNLLLKDEKFKLLPAEKQKKIISFKRYVNSHKSGIFEKNTLKKGSSLTEHIVCFVVKRFIKKAFSRFGIERIKLMIYHQNLLNSTNCLFF